ncbi:competence protein CoiA family protein [Acidaminobacter sp. JC074]|uniref:competence protein CoiA family protein n=1 Tax=Acidaminobacter sp. JC074 TaxID=2530199 RepID=UPI001F0FB6AC|nr:competence protein CoiA family protein [Acidaminobacter sp. JC074]
MYTALLNGKLVQSFDVYNQYGLVIEEKDKTFRLAGPEKALTCAKCGGHVYFNHGTVKKPYFSHYKGQMDKSINHHSDVQSGEHEDGVFVLYHYLSRFYDVQLDYRLDFKRNANLYIEGSKNLAIEFVYHPDSIKKRHEKMKDYKKNRQEAIWVISSKSNFVSDEHRFNQDERTFALEDKNQRIFILDTEKKTLTIRKYLEYFIGVDIAARDKFSKTYDLNMVLFDIDKGFIVHDFDLAYMTARKAFEQAGKEKLQPVSEPTRHLEVKSSDESKRKLIEADKKQGRIKTGPEKTCVLCGQLTSEYRQSLSDKTCVCTCVSHSDALAVRVVRKKKTKEVDASGKRCIICGGISSHDKYLIDDESCIGKCLSKERAESIYKAFKT